jgi:hypothetical protein
LGQCIGIIIEVMLTSESSSVSGTVPLHRVLLLKLLLLIAADKNPSRLGCWTTIPIPITIREIINKEKDIIINYLNFSFRAL